MDYRAVSASILGALLLSLPIAGRAWVDVSFVPDEILVSDPNAGLRGIVDPEFDSINNLFCWVDRRGNVWVADVDPLTGLLDPPSGQGVRVDTGAATVGQIGNGPEWVYTDVGPQVVYTRLVNGTVPILARAFFQNGAWMATSLSLGAARLGPLGSLDRGDPTPTISYLGPAAGGSTASGSKPVYMRYLDDPASEQMIPTTDMYRTPGARAIPGTNAVIFTRPMPSGSSPPRQVFKYDLDTRQLEQLTFDNGNKIAAFMWQAPEYNNEYVFFALLGETRLGIYRYLDPDGDGIFEWTRVQIIDPPSVGDYIWSPEPFVYGGKSYIVMVTSTSSNQRSLVVPTEIWMTDIDPVDTLYRRLNNSDVINRKDPEVYFSEVGPFIYISRADQVSGPKLYRLDSGLGPQAQ